MTNSPKDPLEGFQITAYDPITQKLTIEIHPAILQRDDQKESMAIKAIEII